MSLKIENYEVLGWEHAIRGMRNPMNSWRKCDSYKGCEIVTGSYENCRECDSAICMPYGDIIGCAKGNTPEFVAGYEDRDLMMRLRNAGTDHRKFMRMITVYMDITAPLYWWKEFDTYKVGTTANSCSTMHKIQSKPIEMTDFSFDIYDDDLTMYGNAWNAENAFKSMVDDCEELRKRFLETGDKRYWRALIQFLPSSYKQKRTVMLNYEVLANMYKSRRHHKLDEWHVLCDWIEGLPYSELITGGKKNALDMETNKNR